MIVMDIDNLDTYITNLKKRKKTFNIEKKRSELNVVISGKKIAKFKNKNAVESVDKKDNKSILNIFSSVKKSINRYIIDNDFKISSVDKKHESSFTNRRLFDSLPYGTEFYYVDVKHCYWRIAYLNGYISEYYYNKVLENPDLKIFRNMALACIIAPKKVEYYIDGKHIWTIQEDTRLYEKIYENIRFTSWNIFGQLTYKKIGTDKTIGYFTDGIMIFKEDLPTVRTTLSRYKLKFNIVKCIKKNYREYLNTEINTIKRF